MRQYRGGQRGNLPTLTNGLTTGSDPAPALRRARLQTELAHLAIERGAGEAGAGEHGFQADDAFEIRHGG